MGERNTAGKTQVARLHPIAFTAILVPSTIVVLIAAFGVILLLAVSLDLQATSAVPALIVIPVLASAFFATLVVRKRKRSENSRPLANTVASNLPGSGSSESEPKLIESETLHHPDTNAPPGGRVPPAIVTSVILQDKFQTGIPEFTLYLTFDSQQSLDDVVEIVRARFPFLQNIRFRRRDGRRTWSFLTYAGWLHYPGEKPYTKAISLVQIAPQKFALTLRFSERTKPMRKYRWATVLAALVGIVFPPFAIVAICLFVAFLLSGGGPPIVTSTRAVAADMAFRLQG